MITFHNIKIAVFLAWRILLAPSDQTTELLISEHSSLDIYIQPNLKFRIFILWLNNSS
jgi:hypothetical protein